MLLLLFLSVSAGRCTGNRAGRERRHGSTQRQAAQHARHAPSRGVLSGFLSPGVMVSSLSFPVDQREIEVQPVRQSRRALGSSSVGRDDDPVPPAVDLGLDVPDHGHLGQEVVTGDIEEPLDLRGVQVHRDDVVTPGDGEQVGDESATTRFRGKTGGQPGLQAADHPAVRSGLTWR
jgi:hypothetical protein